MRIFHLTHLAHLAMIIGQLFYSVATGQEIGTEHDRTSREALSAQQIQSTSQHGSANIQQQLTDYYAGSLMLMNEGTIKMSELANKQSSSEEVKQFAKKLADAHRKLNDKLQDIAPQVAQMLQINSGNKDYATGFRGVNNAPQALQGTAALEHVLKIQKKAAENYQNSSTKMMERYQGQDFNMAFLGMQIGAHTWALAELKAMDSVGDRQFQQIVADATSAVQQHLQEAQELSKKFEDEE